MNVRTSTRADPSVPGESQWPAVLGLLALIVVLVDVAHLLHFSAALASIGVIAAVVMLHEAGHFAAAKLGGMKVTEYFLGFGPRLWSIRKGETEYGIKALPLGGYVRIPGMHNLEQVDPADEARTYRQQSFPRRFAVAVAGSSVHFALALIAAWALLAFPHQAKPAPVIASVPPVAGVSPAERAGLDAGDRIVAFDGHPTNNQWTPLHTYIQQHIDQPITLEVLRHRGGQTQHLTIVVTPADATTLRDKTGLAMGTDHVGVLGVGIALTNYSLLSSIPHAFSTFWHTGLDTFKGIGQVFSPHGLSSLGHQVVAPSPSGTADQNGAQPHSIVGIVQIAGQLPGWANKVGLFVAANVFVGVLNLFPVLPFDGGHVAIAVYERIRSRRGRRYFADVNKMLPFATLAMALIVFVSISTLYLDIFHPVTLR